MAVLPQHLPLQPGNWNPLNDFLSVGHNADGTLKNATGPVFNVRDEQYGAKGDGVTDDTAAIQAAITAAGVCGRVQFPAPVATKWYQTSGSLVPLDGQVWRGGGYQDRTGIVGAAIVCSGAVPVIEGNSVANVNLDGLYLHGNTSVGSKGIHATTASGWVLKNLFFDTFADHAIHLAAGLGTILRDVFVQNALLTRTGRGAYIGAVDISGSDHLLENVITTCSFTAATGQLVDGWCAGIVNRSTNSVLNSCIGHLSEVGIVHTNGQYCRYINNRADLNQANGFVVASWANEFIGNLAFRNSRNADNTFAGFKVTDRVNDFTGNRIIDDGADAVRQSNGFDDAVSTGSGPTNGNSYHGNRAYNIRGVLHNLTGTEETGAAAMYGRTFQATGAVAAGSVAITYSASMTPAADKGNYQQIVVTNGTAMTINAPTGPLAGQTLTLDIKNSSGGAHGVITWAATFLNGGAGTVGSGAFAGIANGKRRTIRFYYDGTNWVELSRTTDI